MQKLSPVLSLIGALLVLAGAFTAAEPAPLVLAGAALSIVGGILGFFVKAPQPEPLDAPEPAPEPEVAAMPPAPEPKPAGVPTDGLVLVSLLQEKGRFLDFLMDDISAYPDAQVGAAARIIHQGCKTVVSGAFAPVPVADSAEQSSITLEADFDKSAYRITGELAGDGPYSAVLEHKGWKPTQCVLPEFQGELSSPDEYVFAPAQVSVR
ncbi:MAG: DUF2760 domain-containing protein [Opitutales bacterium]